MNKYISKEEYLEAKGVDLDIELQDDDSHSNKVARFIHEATEYCINYLLLNYCANDLLAFQQLKEFRQERFRKGVMEQIDYILNNGWVMKDAGINSATGMIMDLSKVQMSQLALNEFKLGAFCNIERY